jgi:hypothetical protein
VVSPFQLEEIFPDVTDRSARLPRRQNGGSPQGLTVTLIADYTLRNDAWLPAGQKVQFSSCIPQPLREQRFRLRETRFTV